MFFTLWLVTAFAIGYMGMQLLPLMLGRVGTHWTHDIASGLVAVMIAYTIMTRYYGL